MKKFEIRTQISAGGQYCGDFCKAMFNGDGEEIKHIYCGLFTDYEGSHRLRIEGEDVLRHSLCVQKTKYTKSITTIDSELLSDAIKKRGLSLEKLAKQVGCGKNTIANWMKNRCYPSQDNLNKIANVLNISADDLILE